MSIVIAFHGSELSYPREKHFMPWHLIQIEFKLSDLAFIYKTRVHLAMTRHFTNTIKSEHSYEEYPNNRGKNMTSIGAFAT